jgi:hypothetical protein
MRAVVLVPWRPSDDRRQLLWDWTRPFLEEIGWELFTGDGGGEPFSRAAAMNAAAAAAGEWDVALLGDADTVQDVATAHRAALQALEVGMVIPWSHRIKLSQAGTFKLARRGPEAVSDADRDPRDRTSPEGGGATVVVSRSAWDVVGGMDESFRGYGNEDLAFRAAIETLVIGDGTPRADGVVWHLYHKPVRNVGTRLAATQSNRQRWDLYRKARWKPDAMRGLLGGVRV